MSTTTVLFEDVDAVDGLNFPITFRAVIDFGGVQRWDVDALEVQGARGGWVEVTPGHMLRPLLDAYVASPAGRDAIEGRILREADALWPRERQAYSHAAQ